jgi:hypothetical protein
MFLVIWCACVLDWWFHGFCLEGWILKHANARNASEFNRFFLANSPPGTSDGHMSPIWLPSWMCRLLQMSVASLSASTKMWEQQPNKNARSQGETDDFGWILGYPAIAHFFQTKLFGNDSPPSDDWLGTSHRIRWVGEMLCTLETYQSFES